MRGNVSLLHVVLLLIALFAQEFFSSSPLIFSQVAEASRLSYNSPFQRGKVQLEDLNQNRRSGSASLFSKSQSETVLPAGTRLVLTVNTKCSGTAFYKNEFGDPLLEVESRPFTLTENRNLNELTAEWTSNPCVLGVSRDGDVKIFQVNNSDPRRSEQKHLSRINWAESQALFNHPTFKSEVDVTVAVIDTGVDYNHEDLSLQMWRGPNGERGVNLVAGSGNPMDDNGHGTHCAGILAASTDNNRGVTGVASRRIKILPVKVLDAEGNGNLAALATGIRYAADQGADVINLSVGTPLRSASIEDAMQYAVAKGAVLVVAAGNDGDEITTDNFYSPIGYTPLINGAIGVGSVDALTGRKSLFSNSSSKFVEMAAPGSAGVEKILSTWPNNSYRGEHGTSMASPQVAAAAALVIGILKTQNIPVNPALIENIILESAYKNEALAPYFTQGRELKLSFLKRFLETGYLFQGRGGFDEP